MVNRIDTVVSKIPFFFHQNVFEKVKKKHICDNKVDKKLSISMQFAITIKMFVGRFWFLFTSVCALFRSLW